MGEQPPNDYQAKERLAQCQDIVRAAFGEQSARNDQRGAQVDMRQDMKRKRAEQDLRNFRFQIRVSNYYKALYADVMQGIEDTQAKICQAIIEMRGRLQIAQTALNTLLDQANKLPDGTAVFQYEDGTVRTNTGRILNEQERASLVWQGDMPKGEAFDHARQSLDGLNNGLLLLQGYDADMQGLSNRAADLENTDTPESRLALQDISKQVSAIETKLNQTMHGQQDQPQTILESFVAPAIPEHYSQ